MPRPLGWRQLVPGLVLAVLGIAAVFVVFKYARVGALRGDTVRIHALTDNVAGLSVGSEVWLAGQKVGLVRTIAFAPPTSDTALRLVISADVLDDYQPQIRRDSYAEIRPGGSLVGAPVLTITVGTNKTEALRDRDTLSTRVQTDLEAVTSRAAVASRDFPAIIDNIKLLAAQLSGTTSTVGAIITSEAGAEEMSALSRRTGRLAQQLTRGRGTVGRALQGDAAARARTAAADLDTLRTLLASQQDHLGGFRRDSTLLRSVQALRDEVSIVRALLDEPRGTAGRVLRDQALQQEIVSAEAELTALVADIKARPLDYVSF
jgi:phospholipid/cholesterol/gamma-HCH transport system substrate-binding protein